MNADLAGKRRNPVNLISKCFAIRSQHREHHGHEIVSSDGDMSALTPSQLLEFLVALQLDEEVVRKYTFSTACDRGPQ